MADQQQPQDAEVAIDRSSVDDYPADVGFKVELADEDLNASLKLRMFLLTSATRLIGGNTWRAVVPIGEAMRYAADVAVGPRDIFKPMDPDLMINTGDPMDRPNNDLPQTIFWVPRLYLESRSTPTAKADARY